MARQAGKVEDEASSKSSRTVDYTTANARTKLKDVASMILGSWVEHTFFVVVDILN